MGFKENLLKKIRIDSLADKVAASLGTAESGRKVDREALVKLLAMGPFTHRRERDLDLYLQAVDGAADRILVLDNDVNIYATTVADVALRKSPTVKEMVSIRNAIKILNDADVVVTKKEASVRAVQRACIALLDLSFQRQDLEEIERQGRTSLENGYAEGVVESLLLFADLLHFSAPPPTLKRAHHLILGLREATAGTCGPLAVFSFVDHRLILIEARIDPADREALARFKRLLSGEEEPHLEGPAVLTYLMEMILARQARETAAGTDPTP